MCFSYYHYQALCVYAKTKEQCSEPAAIFITTYLIAGWRPYVYYRHGIELGKVDGNDEDVYGSNFVW